MVYIFVFFMTFLGISGTLYFLNDNFTNIFEFDFSPAPDIKLRNHRMKLKLDSLNEYYTRTKIDTFYIYNDTSLVSKNNNAIVDNERLRFELSTKEEFIADLEKQIIAKDDTIQQVSVELEGLKTEGNEENKEDHDKWLKSTVKLFEKMDAKKAAKIIETYSDNIAKEIIYSMKNKNAAEILSLLNPEKVTKLTGN
ncbi:MAG: hypothetical protein JEY94_18710 [Melioribacteraceae bacterium]|nr:hypothetical protein [Melioribacteraceae bacterium]